MSTLINPRPANAKPKAKAAGVAARGDEIGAVEAKRMHAVGACGRVSSAVGVTGDALRSGQKPEMSNDDT